MTWGELAELIEGLAAAALVILLLPSLAILYLIFREER